jgi:hypothetical protein
MTDDAMVAAQERQLRMVDAEPILESVGDAGRDIAGARERD